MVRASLAVFSPLVVALAVVEAHRPGLAKAVEPLPIRISSSACCRPLADVAAVASWRCLAAAVVVAAVVPWGGTVNLFGRQITLYMADLNTNGRTCAHEFGHHRHLRHTLNATSGEVHAHF